MWVIQFFVRLVRLETLLTHAFFTGRYRRVIGNRGPLNTFLFHLVQEVNGSLPLPTLFAAGNGTRETVSIKMRNESSERHASKGDKATQRIAMTRFSAAAAVTPTYVTSFLAILRSVISFKRSKVFR